MGSFRFMASLLLLELGDDRSGSSEIGAHAQHADGRVASGEQQVHQAMGAAARDNGNETGKDRAVDTGPQGARSREMRRRSVFMMRPGFLLWGFVTSYVVVQLCLL